jgi:PAS domain S-box-containing protein
MSMGDGLACVDGNGLITFWNPGAATIFGYESREMIGTSLWDVLAREDFDGSDHAAKITS